MSEIPTETEARPLVCRAANQAARAVVKVIETHTGKEVSLYDSMRLVNVLGCALERNGLEGGPSGEIRAILEQPYVPKPEPEADAWTQIPPTTQGTYWHWSGDKDSAPLPMFVLWSGTSGKCFVSRGQLGIEHAIDCDQYGGWWKPLLHPAVP